MLTEGTANTECFMRFLLAITSLESITLIELMQCPCVTLWHKQNSDQDQQIYLEN